MDYNTNKIYIMNTRKKINDLIKGAFTLFLIISLAGIVSCEKKDEPVPPAPLPAKYTIKGVVLNQQNNQALPGVLVTMGSLSKTTDASGNFEFKDLTTAGKYTLIFTKDDFFDATYSIEFPEAAPNHVLTLNLSVSMVPYVPGVTPIDPSTGGTINIVAETPASLTIPAGTTVTDKNDVPVTGSINITAVPTTNIVSGTLNNPGLSVLRFEPSGLKFSNPLPLTIDNPLTSVRFSSVQLDFYNESSNQWEKQTQPVTFSTATNKYSTTINHFSIYKLAFVTPQTSLGSLEEAIKAVDPIENTTSSVKNVSVINIELKKGYIFETPLATLISNAGITGTDATDLKKIIEDAIKPYYGNSNALTSFETVNQDFSVTRTIAPNYKLLTTGRQAIDRDKFSISVTGSSTAVIDVVVHSAGTVTLVFQDVSLETHGHGGGGSV